MTDTQTAAIVDGSVQMQGSMSKFCNVHLAHIEQARAALGVK